MLPGDRPDSIDTRIFFRIYAAITGLGGMIVVGWGPMWFGTDLPGLPFGRAALVRVFGALVAAAACWAAAVSQVVDPSLRRTGLMWFAAAHFIVSFVISTQRLAIWGPGPGRLIDQVVGTVCFLLFTLLVFGDDFFEERIRAKNRILSIANVDGIEPLRSMYEQQIREAGAQEERNRLARDLHDSIKQQIFVIQTAAATAQARFVADRAGAALALGEIRDAARDAMTEMEVMMDQLRSVPLENAGLIEALKNQCEALGHRTGARVEFKLGNLPPNETLAPGAHHAILRVAQEALANIGRHARARNVDVSLDSFGERLELRIRDDGVGFDQFQSPCGMGIANMRGRAGELGGQFDLTSSPRDGTTVVFSVPHIALRPGGYGKPAVLTGVAFASVIVIIASTKSDAWTLSALLLAVGFIRYTVAWHRTRNYGKAAA